MSKIKDELYEQQAFRDKELESSEPKGKVNEITILIIHQLTPFHKECLEEMTNSIIKTFQIYWSNRSRKLFEIRIIKK